MIYTHSNIHNVQPTSDTQKSRFFNSLPYSKDNLKLVNKFNFQFSDPTFWPIDSLAPQKCYRLNARICSHSS